MDEPRGHQSMTQRGAMSGEHGGSSRARLDAGAAAPVTARVAVKRCTTWPTIGMVMPAARMSSTKRKMRAASFVNMDDERPYSQSFATSIALDFYTDLKVVYVDYTGRKREGNLY